MSPSTFSAVVELPPQPWTLAVCRGLLDHLLALADVDRPIADDLAVAVTEACSNVVRHAAAGGFYRIEIGVNHHRCVIQVRDRGPGFDPDQVDVTRPHMGGGRGLLVLRAVVDDVRIEPRHPGTDITIVKNVLAELDEVTVPEPP